MIKVRNNKEFLEAVKNTKKNKVIFFDELGMDLKYGKSKYALELAKQLERIIKDNKKRRGLTKQISPELSIN